MSNETTIEPAESEPIKTQTQIEEPAVDAVTADPAESSKVDDPLGAAGQRALEREREARREAERELREQRDRVRELELERSRREVATELRLSDEQAALLSGEDADAMRRHGQAMLEAFAPPKRVGRPREVLRSGATGLTEPSPSMADVADDVMRG